MEFLTKQCLVNPAACTTASSRLMIHCSEAAQFFTFLAEWSPVVLVKQACHSGYRPTQ